MFVFSDYSWKSAQVNHSFDLRVVFILLLEKNTVFQLLNQFFPKIYPYLTLHNEKRYGIFLCMDAFLNLELTAPRNPLLAGKLGVRWGLRSICLPNCWNFLFFRCLVFYIELFVVHWAFFIILNFRSFFFSRVRSILGSTR